MIYTELTRKAINVAFKAHEGQFDKSGIPYVTHPLHVAEAMDDEDSTVAALLHDVIEDTDYGIEDLRKEGFTEKQLDAVLLLTHDKNVPYMKYIEELSHNEIARKVKLSDLLHNMDKSRLSDRTEKDNERYAKYEKAYEFLSGL